MSELQITTLGDSAITVTFGNTISLDLNNLVLSADAAINADPFPGFIETVPAYSSISVFYDPLKIKSKDARDLLAKTLTGVSAREQGESRIVEIPISFAPDDAPDLELLAGARGLAKEQVIEIFTSQAYRVFMLGFLPGFSYMGEVDERIAMPRKDSPRTRVPKGSVGIAGHQTGIYSLESPGGWQIIGRTNLEMFLPGENPPSRLQAGNTVRFLEKKI